MSGSVVEFPVNGTSAAGYLAVPEGGGPGVLVLQEWWGLVPQIKGVCDQLAGEGFTALAPDLYGGEFGFGIEQLSWRRVDGLGPGVSASLGR
jgi:carboxymethylenebutenolidase